MSRIDVPSAPVPGSAPVPEFARAGGPVAAADDRTGVQDADARPVRGHDEDVDALRPVGEDPEAGPRTGRRRDDALYVELTRVNNELATMQHDLAKSHAALAEAGRAKSRLRSMAAHDLRSPLGVIPQLSEFLADDANDRLDAGHRGFVATIRETRAALLRRIDELLGTAAIDSGRLHPDTGGECSHGLGIAIVRRIVADPGGRVEVAGKRGRGSSFGFTVPLHDGG